MGVPLLAEISAKASKAEDDSTPCWRKREMVRNGKAEMKGGQKQKRLAAKSRTLIWRTQSPELIMASAAADHA